MYKNEMGWAFAPSPKLSPLGARCVPPEETEARLRPVLPRVPVTRVSDLTPLDPVRLPAFSAVTPLALDLTTHMGKGLDKTSARVSALMEAVERVSAETAPPGSTLRASWSELAADPRRTPVDPTTLDLPGDSAYAPDRPFTWIESFDLLTGETVWLPADLALNPPREGILHEVDTNGLASGNTRLEAVVHAICEVIERDTFSQIDFLALFADAAAPRPPAWEVDLATLPETALPWVERLREHGLDVTVQDITGDLGVATFRAVVSDYAFPTPSGFTTVHTPGWGTAPDARAAVVRALTEAVQGRLGAIQTARDSFNLVHSRLRPAARLDHLRQRQASAQVPFGRTPTFESRDLSSDLRHLLDRLAAAGLRRVVATDLTQPDFGIPVVRVRVPGLTAFSVNRRRAGWRCLRHLL